MLELHEGGHSGPIRTLRASPPSCAKSLALSCSSTEVHLWDVSAMDHGAAHVFEVGGGGATRTRLSCFLTRELERRTGFDSSLVFFDPLLERRLVSTRLSF